MIIDIHTHIFTPKMIRGREHYFPGEPAFKLLYASAKSKMIDADQIVRSMDEQGVDKSLVLGFPWRSADTFQRHNDYIMEAVSRYPQRLLGMACFDTANKAAAAETQRCLDAGLSGVGELAFYESGIDDDALEQLNPVMEICRARCLPVMLHTNEPLGHAYPGKSPNTLAQIYRLVQRFADNKIVLAHWGGGVFFFSLLKKEVKECLANVYFDTAASPYLYDPDIYRLALQIAGPEKILFGSDYPLIAPGRYFKEFEQAGLTAAEMAKIKGANAQLLLTACRLTKRSRL